MLQQDKSKFEQSQNLSRRELMEICCQQVAAKISGKSSEHWTNSDYIQLSSLIRRKTKVHLNENTLKRIFGKLKTPVDYAPQKATLDALAQFLEFRDWYEFELSQKIEARQIPHSTTAEHSAQSGMKKNSKRLILLLSFLSCCTACLLMYKGMFSPSRISATLICINPEGTSPHSALFSVKSPVPILLEDNKFAIDFADHKKKSSTYTDSIISHYYEIPGRFFPKLILNNKVIDTASVYTRTTGWVAIAEIWNDTSRVFPVTNIVPLNNNFAHVTVNEIFNAGIDTNKTFFVNFCNVKPSSVSGDNFEFSTTVFTSATRPGVRCSQLDVTIFGENDTHYLNLIKPECISWSAYKFSEEFKSGGKSDLRPLGIDLTHGGRLSLIIKKQRVVLSVNGRIILRTSYKNAVGKVMGIKIAFAGIGTFSNLNLKDLSTEERF